MADCCCTPPPLNLDPHRGNAAYSRVLWIVLAINTVMFLVEIGAGLAAGSASLQADALDFLGDAANYAISLIVVGMTLRYRATAALAKGATMGYARATMCWVSRCVACRRGRIWHRHRMAGRHRGCDHGRTGVAGCFHRGPAIAEGAASAGYCASRVGAPGEGEVRCCH